MDTNRFAVVLAWVFVSSLAIAGSTPEPDLKKIMQGLRTDTAAILDGLLVDDFDAVADAASRIAEHPRIPPAQVQLVALELGPEMPAFKRFDEHVHKLSLSILAAAKERDRNSAIADYHSMLDGCLACHAAYRERVAIVLSAPDNAATGSTDPL